MMKPAFTACSMSVGGEQPLRMDSSHGMKGAPYAKPAQVMSTLFAELLPDAPEDVASFLRDAASALGEVEADLARRMGVSHATLSSWKRRGSIPDLHLQWFSQNLVRHIFRQDLSKVAQGFEYPGLEVALAVFKQTDFDPYLNLFGDEVRRVELCFRNLSSLSRLGMFVQSRLERFREGRRIPDYLWDRVTPKVIELARHGTRTV